jgi:hypothetical protein
MSFSVYMVSCNFATYVICPLALTTYKYNELEVSFAIQKLSCKANNKTTIFIIVSVETKYDIYANFTQNFTNT